MVFDINLLIKLILVCLVVDISLFLGLVLKRKRKYALLNEKENLRRVILDSFLNKSTPKIKKKNIELFIGQYSKLLENIHLNSEEKNFIKSSVSSYKDINRYLKMLNSFWIKRRIRAAVVLAYIGDDRATKLIEERLGDEKNYIVKLYLINSLILKESKTSYKVIYKSLVESPSWYQNRFRNLILEYKEFFYKGLDIAMDMKELEIKKAIVYIGSIYYDIRLKDFMLKEVDSYLIKKSYKTSTRKRKFLYFTLECLASNHHRVLDDKRYLESDDIVIRQIAIKSLEKYGGIDSFNKIMENVKDKDTLEIVKSSILALLKNDENLTRHISQLFINEQNKQFIDVYAYVLSYKIEYFAKRLISSEKDKMRKILEKIIFHNYNMGIIDYLNKNESIETENEIIDLLNRVFDIDGSLTRDYIIYLNQDIKNKMHLRSDGFYIPPSNSKSLSIYKKIFIAALFLITLIIAPIIYYFANINSLAMPESVNLFDGFLKSIPIFLGFYYVIINSLYILMSILSMVNSKDQNDMSRIKSKVKNFERAMLPSISIIIPILNHKEHLIDGLNGYLNISYPNYNVILIDDGSIDDSFELLNDYYSLYKEDFNIEKLKDDPSIRSIYRSYKNTKLMYVDKKQTGKTDCLDLGIILSDKEYVCSADIDGAMDQDYLYKLASRVGDDEEETIAVLGNIVPINDCKSIRGCIERYKLPQTLIGKLQYIDLFRNYINLKIAKGSLNSIVLPTGSFCLFKRERLVEIGGYRGYENDFKVDTNKEDIDIMYRLIRHMYDNMLTYKICYSSFGNYYKVLPDNLLELRKLRRRWQREYIDSVITHSDMLLNSNYGIIGEFNSVFNLVLEFIGPLFEIISIIIFIILVATSHIGLDIILFVLFSITLATISSVFPICMLNSESERSSLGEVLSLVLLSIVSSFGYLQIVHLFKLLDMIGAIKTHDGYYQKRFIFKSNECDNKKKLREIEKKLKYN